MRRCVRCKTDKKIDEFESQLNHKYFRKVCKPCKNKATVQHRLKTRFGISPEDYEIMLKEQNYTCAICQQEEKGLASRVKRVKALAVDHDHATGKVRRLLCANCNSALGLMQDSPYLLESAAAYLRSFS